MKSKTILLVFILGVILFNFVSISAMEWDNVKSYNPITKEITIRNSFRLGTDVGKVKLNTPLNYRVAPGYQKVAEFNILAYQDYDNILKSIKFYDKSKVNWEKNEILRDYDIKVKTYRDIMVDDFEIECIKKQSYNGTDYKECNQVKIGSHYERQEYWEEITSANVKKNNLITIGVFTDVQIGDYVEWVPKIYGVTINEWATWIADLNVGLVSYYNLEENTGTTTEDVFSHTYNGSFTGSPTWTTGKINYGLGFKPSSTPQSADFGTSSNLLPNNGTWAGWVFLNGTCSPETGYCAFFSKWDAPNNGFMVGRTNAGKGAVWSDSSGWGEGSIDIPYNSWVFVVATFQKGVTGGTKLYINNSLAYTGTHNWSSTSGNFRIGSTTNSEDNCDVNGTIDEVGVWNRVLSEAEITTLYNSGMGLTYKDIGIGVTLNSPINNYNSTSSSINFNCSGASNTGLIYLNLSVDGDYIYNLTGTGDTNLSLVHSVSLSEGTHNWTCTVSDGTNIVSAPARNLFIDSIFPTITLNYPVTLPTLINYGINNTTLQLNITANDTHLDKVWYNYNGTNITLTGAISGIYNVSNITLSEKKNITIYANDTIGNLNATTFNWDYKIFENLRTFNSTSYETAYESYKINLTSNGNLSSVNLLFNGTSYSMTNEGGEIWSYSRNIPSSAIGNNSINFSFIYSGNTIYSSKLSYQIINSAVLSICNATYNVPFINFTFKDESSSSSINATIPTSTFVYWLGSGTVNKTLTYSNNTANNNYTFCFSPTNRNVTIDMILQYQGTDYPQRIYNPTVMSFSNSTYNKTLYLLSVVDGLYVTFQVINTAEQVISGVLINATRTIGSEDVVVGDGTTDSSGTVTFWLNPNFQHIIQAFKSGYKTGTLSVFPTQSSYTIQLGTTTTVTEQDYVKGIKISIKPTANQLNNGTSYNFNMTLNSSYWDVESFGFVLRNSTTGDILGSNSSSSNGGIVSFDLNTGNNTTIIMQYYYVINSTYQNYTRTWTVADLTANTGFGVVTLFNRFKTYLTTGDGIFGLNDFGVAIIIFIIIFGSVGIASWKWSITSPAIITTILFVEVLLFDVVLGLLPNVANVHFISIVAGILAVSMVAKEGIR